MADDLTFKDAPRQQTINGKAAVRDWYASWAEACPDAVAGGKVIAASGTPSPSRACTPETNTGPLGPLPATGRSIPMPWANVLRFGAGGKIVGGSAYYDQFTLLTQLGHLQDPA